MRSLAAAIHQLSADGEKEKEMLPYQEDEKKLEKLLERLFEDDESIPDGVEVLSWPGPQPFGSCCRSSYSSYGA